MKKSWRAYLLSAIVLEVSSFFLVLMRPFYGKGGSKASFNMRRYVSRPHRTRHSRRTARAWRTLINHRVSLARSLMPVGYAVRMSRCRARRSVRMSESAHETVIPSVMPGMALWRERLFAWMARTAASPMTSFKMPVNRVVEMSSLVVFCVFCFLGGVFLCFVLSLFWGGLSFLFLPPPVQATAWCRLLMVDG